ncbi:MAG: N(4)-(beta-N-acetylglucosaminyl)-L-asparaginase [Gemmatimonadota bacterium]|jgi:N4-(beta-N-acetylglucosaminyl)-L-asparaginase|nr:N(4)-(beta-N-acetylglucosaminyl)-L-asparaginase [Gemmatimonadota bacterium]
MSPTRRTFLGTTASTLAAAAAALARPTDAAAALAPAITTGKGRPAVVASENGLRGVAKAREMLLAGRDPLDAIIAGVNIQELDPEDNSVGLGGLPNAEGVVQLDASVMHGPSRRAGAVACLEDIATPSLVAKAVMDHTHHVLLVGRDARRFALDLGFTPQNLLTEASRQAWLRWRATLNPRDAWRDDVDPRAVPFRTGTINMNAVTAAGDLASCTTTSGLAYKVPGRVGDSPIVGAGQYCDNTVGAAGATGLGETNIKACGAMLLVEFMRQGTDPQAAALKVLERVLSLAEPRQLDARGRPRFDLTFYAVHKDGRTAGASFYEGAQYAVADDAGPRLEPAAYLFRRGERPA